MAEEINKTYTSNSLYNDSTGVIAFAEQLKQELINWANYHHVTEELGPNYRPDTQSALNNLFLSVYERFLTFLNDADATEEAINTWKEIERFLADYTDEKTLAEIVAELNANIESRLTVPLESTTGSSTTSTMTQKAITETIDASKTFTTGEKVDNVGIDSEPTTGSENLVKSGGVFNKLSTIGFFNVNLYNNVNVYSTKEDARNGVPSQYRKEGICISYKLSDGWHYEQKINTRVGSVYWAQYLYWMPLFVDNTNNILYDNFKYPSFTLTNGYLILSTGVVSESPTYSYSSPIQLLKGETIVLNDVLSSFGVSKISITNVSGSSYTPKVIDAKTNRVYRYTAEEDCYVAFSASTDSIANQKIMIFTDSKYNTLKNNVDELNESASHLNELVGKLSIQKIETTVGLEGAFIAYNEFHIKVNSSSASFYSITGIISVPAHSTIATFSYGENSRISQKLDDGYIPLVMGINDPNTYVSWSNNSDSAVDIVISYINTQPLNVFIYNNIFNDILSKIPNIELYGKMEDTTPNLTMNDGYVVEGNIQQSTTYKISNAFLAKRGDFIVIIQSRFIINGAALFKTDESLSYAEHVLPGVLGTTPKYQYYIVPEDGYYGISGNVSYMNMRKYTPSSGYMQTLIKDEKKKIPITYTGNTSITVTDTSYCQITKGLGKKISGTGNCTITGTLQTPTIGRCLSVGFKIPYATQDVAKVIINDTTFNKSTTDSRTASGKAYVVEGDNYHRTNYDVRYGELNTFTIEIQSDTDWVIEMSAEAVLNDDLPITPILVGYDDMVGQYRATFPYEGENISVYELHKRLQIPYYVSTIPGATLNPEVVEAIESGLCEVVFYGGSSLVDYWNKTDGTLAEEIFKRKAATGIDANMFVLSQAVLDKNMYRNIKNAGTEMIRHYAFYSERTNKMSQKYGDNDVFYTIASALGQSTMEYILRMPQVWYGHGIGTPINPEDPYASYYADPTGANTIALFTMWKTLQEQGRVKVMKPSDWITYCKKYC